MHLARAATPTGPVTGRYEDGRIRTDDDSYEVGTDAQLLPPCEPTAVYCVGRNYTATLDQMDYTEPDEPDFFIKPPVAVHPPDEPVTYPAFTAELTYAGELAAVIDERCRNVPPEDVADVVRGYTIMNDLDCLDQPGRTARKAFYGSAPLGPVIATDIDPLDVAMETTVGGELRQSDSTARMLFGPAAVISFLSARFPLNAGDVVAFGSPANPGLVEPGESVRITYEGIGTLRTPIAATEGSTKADT